MATDAYLNIQYLSHKSSRLVTSTVSKPSPQGWASYVRTSLLACPPPCSVMAGWTAFYSAQSVQAEDVILFSLLTVTAFPELAAKMAFKTVLIGVMKIYVN
ncbi:unnamed protein product, partial [Rangifer tarandus platyrhynchus]